MAENLLTSLDSRSLFSRPLRLASGIVLFAYVATHIANHAVGWFRWPPRRLRGSGS